MMVRSVVVLPAPLRPTRHTTSRSRTSRETQRRMWLAWINTSMAWTASMLLVPPHHLSSRLAARGARLGSNCGPLPPLGVTGELSLSPLGRGQGEGRPALEHRVSHDAALPPYPSRARPPRAAPAWHRPAPCPGAVR